MLLVNLVELSKFVLAALYDDELRVRLRLRAYKLLPEYVSSERSLEKNLQ